MTGRMESGLLRIHLTRRHCAREERTFFWVRLVTSLLTARRSPARRACSSATPWNYTMRTRALRHQFVALKPICGVLDWHMR